MENENNIIMVYDYITWMDYETFLADSKWNNQQNINLQKWKYNFYEEIDSKENDS